MAVIDKDMGWTAMLETTRKLDTRPYVQVGVQGSQGDAPHGDDGMTNVQLAVIHEYGLGVPRRSFIRDAIDEHWKDINGWLTEAGQKAIAQEATLEHGLALVGQKVLTLIRNRIRAHIYPPLKKETIKRKGGIVTPLVWHSTLLRSITSVVVDTGETV